MALEPHRSSFLALDPHGFHRVAIYEWGDPRQHHVVVCVHGLTRNGRDFDILATHLAQHCRVVSMDVVGRGASEWLVHKVPRKRAHRSGCPRAGKPSVPRVCLAGMSKKREYALEFGSGEFRIRAFTTKPAPPLLSSEVFSIWGVPRLL